MAEKKSKNKLVEGIGVNDYNEDVTIKGMPIVSYNIWKIMLHRCYSPQFHRQQPTYTDCSVCDEWLYFSNFKRWFEEHYRVGCQLDKDLIVNGNKIYSPETCCFVPRRINTLLLNCKKSRGALPVGLSYSASGKQIKVRCSIGESRMYLGRYNTVAEAFSVYKATKEAHIKSIAEEYFNRGEISVKVYNSLLSYEINIEA